MNTRQQHDKREMILYQPDGSLELEVRFEDKTVWLNRHQMPLLFGKGVKTIGKHINNALGEELSGISAVANFATTAADGKTYQVAHYSLDVVLSVGYRVKSDRGVRFRIWSNRVLKEHALMGHAVDRRFERIEERVAETERKVEFFVKAALPPVQGVFFEGQVFDAHSFASGLIRSAKESVMLIDNYVDEAALLLLSKRQPGVTAEIYTRRVTPQLRLDLARHNTHYERVTVRESDCFHDRFLIVDHTAYHIGSSLKDLGKKLFAFSKMEMPDTEILRGL